MSTALAFSRSVYIQGNIRQSMTTAMHFMSGEGRQQTVNFENYALHMLSGGSICLLTLCLHPGQQQIVTRMRHCHALVAFGATANSQLTMRMMHFMSGLEAALASSRSVYIQGNTSQRRE